MVRVFVNERFYADMQEGMTFSGVQIRIAIPKLPDSDEDCWQGCIRQSIVFEPFIQNVVEKDGSETLYAFVNDDRIRRFDNDFYFEEKGEG